MTRHYKWLKSVIFTACGVLFGLGYYYFAGGNGESSAISSNPVSAMIYMGIIGWLASLFIGKGCGKGCSM